MTCFISITPDPAIAGEQLEICFDFGEVSNDEIDLEVRFDGIAYYTLVLTPESPCTTVSVPANALELTIVDLTANTPPFAGGIVDP